MNDKYKHILRVLREYVYNGTCLCNMSFNKSPEFLDEYYSKQAALDLIELIMDNKKKRPMEVVEEYRSKMDKYSTMNSEFGIIYSIKYDFATYILDRLIA